ncbi:MAG: hypothetical protein J3R72DRAFT_508477 [Linnemannia gamsii]|nr:MAG: hypothetical protein J3R72DRAFT_508477 [Linnemannia gamsii]
MHGELESFKAGATRSSCRSMKRMGESSSPIAARNDSRMELVVCLSTILFARGPWSPHKEKRYGVDGFKNRPSVQVGARINYPCEARECMDGPHVMEACHPDLYEECLCRLCEIEEEDNGHVWTCPTVATTTTTIWKEAMGRIDEWGNQATNTYNTAKKREYEKAMARGRQEPPPTPVVWRCPMEEEHVRGFSSIGGARMVHAGQPVPDRDTNSKWQVADVLRGLTPKSLLLEWSTVFRGPQSIARAVLHDFVGYLEAQASEMIWKPRCTATVEWELKQGITAKAKKTKYTGPRGDWSQGYGYITQDGIVPAALRWPHMRMDAAQVRLPTPLQLMHVFPRGRAIVALSRMSFGLKDSDYAYGYLEQFTR